MIKKHLHRQIYLTIIASLVLVVVLTGFVFSQMQSRNFDRQVYDITARLTWRSLPPATASNADQSVALNELTRGTDLNVSLFDSNKNLIAAYGAPIPPPTANAHEGGWHRHKGVRRFRRPIWLIQFPDGRWFAVDPGGFDGPRPIFKLLMLLASVTLAIGLASYPFVRRLTGRLQRLQETVDIVGTGNLSKRAKIEGSDEVAHLATSFNEATDKIERLVKSNRQLLANASHELRTPLARVRLGVEMLRKKRDPNRQKALEQDITELDDLIDEILLMSRLDSQLSASDKILEKENIDLLALASEECARYDNCTLTGDHVEVLGDANLLRRMIRNLLDNAQKHGKPPMSISLQAGKEITLTVSDKGDGILLENQESVFQPFHREPGKQNVQGYGLGLALVKQIAEIHGGEAIINPAKATGFSISVILPRA